MDPSSWFTDTVTVQSPSGLSTSGSREKTWGAQRTIACHYNAGQKKVQNATGEVVTTVGTIRCTDVITTEDRVWPPGADTTDATQARRPVQALSSTNKQRFTIYRIELA